jgi:ribosomal protein S18 acetylase RimI-like enzyme
MLIILDLADGLAAAELLALQRVAYQSEADLIHYPALPPLHESLPQLIDCGESIFGWREDDKLCGAIGFSSSLIEIQICRLAVAPQARRRGIAAKLIQAVLVEAGPRPVTVSTAKANAPGIALYQSLGLYLRSETTTPDGLPLVQLHRWSERSKAAID